MKHMNASNNSSQMPPISILMAIYEPHMDWLREQLESLERQTYPNLKLYIREDCSPSVSFEEITQCVKKSIHSIPYEIKRNEKNIGSNLTFQRLTEEAEGDFFAYCDQDDVWLPEKIETLFRTIESEQAELVCSDMFIIDESGKQIADSITKVRRHHVFKSGEGLAPQLLISNFATGCTVLVKADDARKAVPFCPYMVHDHYLAFRCAEKGRIITLPKQLIRYRIHEENQTLLMSGVTDKQSYCRVRIDKLIHRLTWLRDQADEGSDLRLEIEAALEWAQARRDNLTGKGKGIWKALRLRRFGPKVSLFEVVLGRAPDIVFIFFINLVRKNIL